MEYIDGITLLELLKTKGPLEMKEAVEIAAQFLAGLDAIHQAGLVHRDLKPENLMITRAGRVVVMDFGIAKPATESGPHTVSGTPAYMAPEQLRGEPVDARADVFSAGVVLAEMVSDEGIQEHASRETLWSGIRMEPPRVPECPWSPVIRKAVSTRRDERYPSAQALVRALEGSPPIAPYNLAYGPAGRWAAVGGVQGIRLWDFETGDSKNLVERRPGQDVGTVQFVGNGRLVTTESGALRLWQLEDGTSRKIREDPWKKAWTIDVSPDGRFLLSAGGDTERGISEVVFQDLETGESRTLSAHGDRVLAVALDPTGTIAVTGDSDGVGRVGPVTGEAPHLLFGHEGLVYSLAVGPEGRWIASGGEDASVRLWPMPQGRPFHTLPYGRASRTASRADQRAYR